MRPPAADLDVVDRASADPGARSELLDAPAAVRPEAIEQGILPPLVPAQCSGMKVHATRMRLEHQKSDSATLNRIAELARRGAPFGEVGRAGPTRPASKPLPEREVHGNLRLATGLLDDHRKLLRPGDDFYALFRWTRRWQDTWTDAEHGEFWEGALAHWPRGGEAGRAGGKYSHGEALAYAVASAAERGIDLEAFLAALSAELRNGPAIRGLTASEFTLQSLQRRGILGIAVKLVHAEHHQYPDSLVANKETEAREPGRVPRVLPESAPDVHLAVAQVPIEVHAKRGEASGAIVSAAIAVLDVVAPEVKPGYCALPDGHLTGNRRGRDRITAPSQEHPRGVSKFHD